MVDVEVEGSSSWDEAARLRNGTDRILFFLTQMVILTQFVVLRVPRVQYD